jgi:hypothetical protein
VRRERTPPTPDPFVVLGLSQSAGEAEIEGARRALAKSFHPDTGGSLERMQQVNAAADRALSIVRAMAPTKPAADGHRQWRGGPARTDHPSFTIEALPAEAFEGLLVVASELGDVIDDDPPYRLEVAMADPIRGWCQVELAPDAGASSVSLSVASEPGSAPPDVDRVRDVWIDALNRLDWTDLGDSRQQP